VAASQGLALNEHALESSKAYQEAHEVFDLLIEAMQWPDAVLMDAVSIPKVDVRSSHRGELSGPDALAGIFGPFAEGEKLSLDATNVYLAGTERHARASAYLAVKLQGGTRLAFGAILVVDLAKTASHSGWTVSAVKLQITWVEGATTQRPSWSFPDHNRVWQVGDPLPVIVSEVDAPWHVYSESVLRPDEARGVADTYARYSWGIDQADFGLLASCYTEDAAGTFRPMGPLSGRHAILGVLKDFRRAWPVMQHHGEVLGSIIEGDRAAIIVGRLIPQAGQQDGAYGAYYPMRLVRDGSKWRIRWTEYRPGWFNRSTIDLPALLAATMSAEGDWAE